MFDVDVDVSAQAKGQVTGSVATADRHGPKAHPLRILDRHVTQTANTQNGYRITSLCPRAFQAIEGCYSGTQDRCSMFRGQLIRDRNQPGMPRRHHLGIAAVAGRTRDRLLPAQVKLAAAAHGAGFAMPAKSADSNALADLPDPRNACPKGEDPAHNLMARYTPLHPAFDIALVSAADAAGFHGDQRLASLRFGAFPMAEGQPTAGDDLHRAVSHAGRAAVSRAIASSTVLRGQPRLTRM